MAACSEAFTCWGSCPDGVLRAEQVTASRERVHSLFGLCVVYVYRLFLPLFLPGREFADKGQLALSGTGEQKVPVVIAGGPAEHGAETRERWHKNGEVHSGKRRERKLFK